MCAVCWWCSGGVCCLGCCVSKFVHCGVLDPGFAASLLVPRTVSLLIEAIGRHPWHVEVDSFRHVVVEQVLLASLETEDKTRRRWRRCGVVAYVWTVHEMACFLRPSCDHAATGPCCPGQDYSDGATDSVLRRQGGGAVLGQGCWRAHEAWSMEAVKEFHIFLRDAGLWTIFLQASVSGSEVTCPSVHASIHGCFWKNFTQSTRRSCLSRSHIEIRTVSQRTLRMAVWIGGGGLFWRY